MKPSGETSSVFHCTDDEHLGPWHVVNDDVMGGVSRSCVSVTQNQTLVFEGVLSLENNGGFASTKSELKHALDPALVGIAIRFRSNTESGERVFHCRVRTHLAYVLDDKKREQLSYTKTFGVSGDTLQTVTLAFSDFFAIHKGRPVENADPLRADFITHIGFLLADKKPGPFSLEVKNIELLYAPT